MISIPVRCVSKRELLMQVPDPKMSEPALVVGWHIELVPVQPDPTNQELVLAGKLPEFLTLLREVADQFTVGEDTRIELPATVPYRPQIAVVGSARPN